MLSPLFFTDYIQQPHAGRECQVAGCPVLQKWHRQILEESGASVSACMSLLLPAATLSLFGLKLFLLRSRSSSHLQMPCSCSSVLISLPLVWVLATLSLSPTCCCILLFCLSSRLSLSLLSPVKAYVCGFLCLTFGSCNLFLFSPQSSRLFILCFYFMLSLFFCACFVWCWIHFWVCTAYYLSLGTQLVFFVGFTVKVCS